tara:strand:- start:55 stop:528 length:474 start_codon:yes stop_codon:yes gene_type:complete
MKKLILLLLFIPLVSSGQLSYKDVMKIDSKDTFIKLMIENGYESTDRVSVEGQLFFGYRPEKDDNGEYISTAFANYVFSEGLGLFSLQFSRPELRYGYDPYDEILQKVKKKCKFVNIRTIDTNKYACYECKKAEFNGYIAFANSGKTGLIAQFLFKD